MSFTQGETLYGPYHTHPNGAHPHGPNDIASLPASKITAETFGAGAFTFPSNLTVNGAAAFVNPITVDTSSTNVAFIGEHPVHTAYVTLSRNNLLGSSDYGLIISSTNTILNVPTGGVTRLRVGNVEKFTASSTENVSYQALRAAANLTADLGVDIAGGGSLEWPAYGGTIHMQDTSWIRFNKPLYTAGNQIRSDAAGDAAVQALGGMTHGATGARGGEAVIGTWTANHATFGRYGTVNLGGGNPLGFMMRNDGFCWIGATDTLTFRLSGADLASFRNSGGLLDCRMTLPAILGNTARFNTGSRQLGYDGSSKRYKRNIRNLPESGKSNPLWNLRPVRFNWGDNVVGGAEANARHPDGVAGLVAEEVAAAVPDAVTWDEDGPSGLDDARLIAYLVAAVQHLKFKLDLISRRPLE